MGHPRCPWPQKCFFGKSDLWNLIKELKGFIFNASNLSNTNWNWKSLKHHVFQGVVFSHGLQGAGRKKVHCVHSDLTGELLEFKQSLSQDEWTGTYWSRFWGHWLMLACSTVSDVSRTILPAVWWSVGCGGRTASRTEGVKRAEGAVAAVEWRTESKRSFLL